MHAYAADDPVFVAMNKRGQRETNGELGTFCVKCHAPMAVANGTITEANVANFDLDDAAARGERHDLLLLPQRRARSRAITTTASCSR